MTFSIGGSFPSGATAFQKAIASGSALFIASRMANCISSFTAFSVVSFSFAICLKMSFTSASSYVY
jgi:hypothetical protein